jgi:gliding motility-associated-like protein
MLKKASFLLVFILTSFCAYSQCTNGLGVPLITETFGSGSSLFAPPLPAGVTDFQYVQNTCPMDGQYTIVNYTTGCYGEWHTLTDYSGDPNGYFMIVNASDKLSTFYTSQVNGLCPGTNYKFSAYIVNLDTQDLIEPNITFSIEKPDGTRLGSYNTGDIKVYNFVYWQKFFFYFKTPTGVSDVVLRMRNNAPGGSGNNFAIDSISFAPSGPGATINIQGISSDTLYNPYANSTTLLSAIGSCYIKNAYQWQISSDKITWTDIPGANNPNYVMSMPAAGSFYYRLGVAETGNIANTNCRAISNEVKIVNGQYFPTQFKNVSASICQGDYVFPSSKKVNTSGTYTDTLFSKSGCDSIVTTINLLVATKPNLGSNRDLCVGDTVLLTPGLFNSYLWQDNSTGPTYEVTKGGTYWVKVTDAAGCDLADTVNIKEAFCSTIKIPNTFTPNGDGVNDTWNIPQLQHFPNCSVFIYNRWGQTVFSGNGYPKPWNGLYKGKPLPIGAYYYVIDLKNNTSPLSGFITIIR